MQKRGMSMKRLTSRKEDGHAYVIGCPEFEVPKEANTVLQSVVDKCADLEDILDDTYDLVRLRELVEADKAGRCKDCKHAGAWINDEANCHMNEGYFVYPDDFVPKGGDKE